MQSLANCKGPFLATFFASQKALLIDFFWIDFSCYTTIRRAGFICVTLSGPLGIVKKEADRDR